MDWALAISRNRNALLAVVAAIVALIGGREGGPIVRRIRNAALALLRPAEAAARRLIVIAARGVSVAPGSPRPPIGHAAAAPAAGVGRTPAFRLFECWPPVRPRRKAMKPHEVPRIRTFWGELPPPRPELSVAAAPPDPGSPVNAGRLRLRLRALEAALADLPRQARRLARWRARRQRGLRPCAPLRPGRPPGWRRRPDREVDVVLRECHALACEALRSDTS